MMGSSSACPLVVEDKNHKTVMTRTQEVVSLHADNDPAPQNPKEFSRWRGGATKR